ncbi:CPBP family intramembrane glutamic endopeptidase [Metabacillus malikii]|uniref:Membrane protease YdiL (CAAX protease family) n=1 Tax=Metabacillus malikii TaxID=1504265 RepID=A0ABT9ZKX8_9BACI|nr:CPBP family intramembrane glutamic endopeptidase [Metabacillus malikii]MDQ0232928.1 membrane protease YdiL (CAAX protease family) [Metabacillus malikii]
MLKKQSEQIKELTDKEIVISLYMTQLLIFVFSCILSLFLFNSYNEFKVMWDLSSVKVIYYGVSVAAIVIVIDYVLMKVLPVHLLDDGGVNDKIFKNRSIPHIVILTGIIAISEEFLFRGVIQTNYGIWIASIIFALLHFRYVTKWVLFTLVISISFLLGIVYELTDSLYTTILAHFIIDLVFAIQIRLKFIKGVRNNNE